MQTQRFPERRPILFSFLLVLLLVAIQAVGVVVAERMGLPPTSLQIFTGCALALALSAIVSALRWWGAIGFRRPERVASLVLFIPALALLVGNLTFGISQAPFLAIAVATVAAASSGFVEEVVFRGLMLRAFLPRGAWTAVITTSAVFGLTHALNVFAGYTPLYALLQVAYALAIGFCFGAMVVKSRLLWPLIIVHGLGNFAAFLNDGQVGMHLYVVTIFYVVLFTGYGLYLMTRPDTASPTAEPAAAHPVY
jgi:uncharacterized protein